MHIGFMHQRFAQPRATGMVKEALQQRRIVSPPQGFTVFPAGKPCSRYVMPPAAIPDESRFFTHSGANCRICGCCDAPRPTASDRAIIRIARRFSGSRETIRTPEARTGAEHHHNVAPRRAPVPGYAAQNRYRREQAERHNQHQRDDKSPHSDWRRQSTGITPLF